MFRRPKFILLCQLYLFMPHQFLPYSGKQVQITLILLEHIGNQFFLRHILHIVSIAPIREIRQRYECCRIFEMRQAVFANQLVGNLPLYGFNPIDKVPYHPFIHHQLYRRLILLQSETRLFQTAFTFKSVNQSAS